MTSETNKTSVTKAWIMLLLAGLFEIGYALSVGGSEAFTVLSWSISAVIFFLLTLYTLSVALNVIDVGIGYAVWAGIGAIGASVFGGIVFDQMLSLTQAFWLGVIIVGVIWLKLAGSDQLQDKSQRLA
ncbi:DMT family transporter [Vibrio rhodolitus]|uniref:DMT family transporter n=1 Tax=Vibrio rhodolitus TaxID=2231649 RepID=UPI000E0B3F93|nr:multidrug efflux SMR transporter [Vibrio rhodolitus]